MLNVSPLALSVPDIDSYVGLMHTLFTLEDLYGLRISNDAGDITLRVDPRAGKDADRLHEMLCAWAEQAEKLKAGESNAGRLRRMARPLSAAGHIAALVGSHVEGT